MPTLAQGEARTIFVSPSSSPSNTLTAVLPPGVTISLESVLAAIDATGAGDTIALLEIADSSGVVIARKAQGQVVTGGSVGSATWALRLDDERGGAAPPPTSQSAFTIDFAASVAELAQTSEIAGPPAAGFACATISWKCALGAIVRLSITNYDSVAHDFALAFFVQDLESDTNELGFQSAVLTVGAGLAAPIGFQHGAGAAILDYTDPFHPTVSLAASRYCFMARVDVIV